MWYLRSLVTQASPVYVMHALKSAWHSWASQQPQPWNQGSTNRAILPRGVFPWHLRWSVLVAVVVEAVTWENSSASSDNTIVVVQARRSRVQDFTALCCKGVKVAIMRILWLLPPHMPTAFFVFYRDTRNVYGTQVSSVPTNQARKGNNRMLHADTWRMYVDTWHIACRMYMYSTS